MQQIFELDGEYITLCNLLKVCGITDTGGIAKLMIADGWIKVDGQVEFRKACKIRAGQVISGDDFAIAVVSSNSNSDSNSDLNSNLNTGTNS